MEGWFFKREGGERIRIRDLDDGFKEGSRELQDRGEGLIRASVENGEDTSKGLPKNF